MLAAALSAVVPGSGQWYAGARRRAGYLFLIDLALITVAGVALLNKLEVVKAAFRPGFLISLMIGNVAVLAFRAWAADDAYRVSAGKEPARGSLLAALAIAAVVVAPHAVAGYYDVVHYNFITSTFAADDVGTTTTTTSAPIAVGVTPTSAVTTTTVAPGPALWDGLERLNILLLGGDAGAGRKSIRTDTMMVVSIDPKTGDVALFGLPRNFVRVPLPDGMGFWDCNCFPRLLNDLYVAGIETPAAFPGPGTPPVNAIKGGMQELLGIPIHYYALVTLDGFVGVVDALGGVTIDVPYEIVDATYPDEDGVTIDNIDIRPGKQHLDGHLALAYVRARRNANDYARMGRQRCLLNAILAEADPAGLALAYPRIAGVLEDTLKTDIPLSRIPDFIDLLPRIDRENLVSVRFIPPTYVAGTDSRGFNIPNVDLIRKNVQIVMNSTPSEARQALGINPIDESCST